MRLDFEDHPLVDLVHSRRKEVFEGVLLDIESSLNDNDAVSLGYGCNCLKYDDIDQLV